jgi:hypothetical protein
MELKLQIRAGTTFFSFFNFNPTALRITISSPFME